ncbi:MAG: hypothetical protein FWF52_07185 [Candidatus Azobacteroides sp.]|nr:hypothetical protein [Candidatus Azobacteroides sp.]
MKKRVFGKRLAVLLGCFVFVCGGLQAQNTFAKGDQVINLGIGLGTYSGKGYVITVPPIVGSFEYGIKDHLFDDKSSLGIGGYIGYMGDKLDVAAFQWKFNHLFIGARGALHYQLINKLDTYAGLMLGYEVVSANSHEGFSSPIGSGFSWALYAGGRYYFTDKFGVFAEVGYGVAALQLGVAFKL